MVSYEWPDAQHRSEIGKRELRVDGPDKVSGRAKYTFDANPPGLLFSKVVTAPYAHCRVKSIDTSAAEKMPGVKAIEIMQEPGKEIHWAGDQVVAVAATSEEAARDALRAIKVEYEVLPHFVDDFTEPGNVEADTSPLTQDDVIGMFSNQVPEPEMIAAIKSRGITFQPGPFVDQAAKQGAPKPVLDALQSAQVKPAENQPKSPYKLQNARVQGDPDKAFADPEIVISEGLYGASVITHCCLESHGVVAMWTDPEHLDVQVSTQNVSGIPAQLATLMQMPAANIHMHQQNVGGGFGSKFAPDAWSKAAAQLSKKADGKPVKLMLERAEELEVAGARPSAFSRVRVAVKKEGTIVGWDSKSWGTGGPGGGGMPPIPYVFTKIPNVRTQHTAISTNAGPSRAWRAPNHPQAAAITMCALDDAAARIGMDPYDFWMKNLDLTARADVYRQELEKADELMRWKQRWHARGDKSAGPLKRGMGLSIHTWGGRGHASDCDLAIYPDGSVDIKMGTQDLGTGTRTAILMVAGETLGLPIEAIKLNIGDTNYPKSGGSGGSTTIGGVSSSTRRAAVDAVNELFANVAPVLNAKPEDLEAKQGTIRVAADPKRSLTWKQACAKIGAVAITAHGHNDSTPAKNKPDLTNSGVGGVQMADVTVDTDTGIVRVNKMVAVQDCGLIVSLTTAESQCYGALIMGIAYSLYEEKIMDPTTGRMLNPNMEFYRLAGIGDIGELVVHMMTGPGYDERGVIGLGEPPVISPGAALSNAVANAIGVRVAPLPLTPNRVLAALGAQKGGA